MTKECILMGAPSAIPMSPAVRAGENVFVSGQLAFGPEGKLVGENVAEQTRQCLDNIKAILAKAGCEMTDIVKCSVWLVNVEDFSAFNAEYAQYFPANPPARATVRSDLMVPGALVEIDAIAYCKR